MAKRGEDELGTQAKEYIDQGKKVILYCTKNFSAKRKAREVSGRRDRCP